MNNLHFKDISVSVFFIFATVLSVCLIMPVAKSDYIAQAEANNQTTEIFVTEPEIIYNDKKYSPDDKLGDTSCLDNSAFLGNSHAEALKLYGLIPGADYYTKVGMSVLNVLKPDDNGKILIESLNNKVYDRVFMMFGENELGWPYPKNFIREYEKIIDEARRILPDADIYIESIFPVSLEVSEKSHNGINNRNIEKYNKLLAELAASKDNVYFINPAEAVTGKDGNLPAEASTDGMHFNYGYCKIWVNYLLDNIIDRPEASETETESVVKSESRSETTATKKSVTTDKSTTEQTTETTKTNNTTKTAQTIKQVVTEKKTTKQPS